jgi:hypothetical protein
VLSGNRNFEGRIHPQTKLNYLASPPLVIAYALAGTMDTNLTTDPLGTGSDGRPVYLRDIWPSQAEISEVIASCLQPEMFTRAGAAGTGGAGRVAAAVFRAGRAAAAGGPPGQAWTLPAGTGFAVCERPPLIRKRAADQARR